MRAGASTALAILIAGASGCLSTLTMESARTLREGENRVTVAAGVDVNRGDRYSYQEPFDEPPGELEAYPDIPANPQLLVAVRRGLSARVQGELLVHTLFGVGLGLKVQAAGDRDSLFALSLATRFTGSVFGDGTKDRSGAVYEVGAQGGAQLSVHPSPRLALYASPRLALSKFAAIRTRDGERRSAGDGAVAFGSGGGVEVRFPGAAALYFEVVTMRFPEAEAWMNTFAVGVAFLQERASRPSVEEEFPYLGR